MPAGEIDKQVLIHLINAQQLEIEQIGKLPNTYVKARLNRGQQDMRDLAGEDMAQVVNRPSPIVSTQEAHLAEQVQLMKGEADG